MKVGIFLLIFFLNAPHAQSEIVQIVSDMYTEEVLQDACFKKVKDAYEIRITDQKHKTPFTTNCKYIKRYIVFNLVDGVPNLNVLPAEKKVLFMMEPKRISQDEAECFSRIYTWDDDAVDGEKTFKYYFPDLLPMISNLPAFEEKKLCTMIVRNWHPAHRKPIVDFFSKLPKGEFEFYGSPLPGLLYSKCYKGRIPGTNCGMEKIEVLKNYRFCFCVENKTDLRGYVTEKIFPCFAAGCVPIYWGAPNIDTYIPTNCYIDYRDFTSHEELYLFLKSIPEEVYEEYLSNIRCFIMSDQAQLFSPEHFAQTLYEAVVQ